MATRKTQVPGATTAAPEDEISTTETQGEQQTGSDEQSTEQSTQPTVEELQAQLAAAQAENNSLKGQIRRSASTTVAPDTQASTASNAGKIYLSEKGWTRG
uniref:hypothetical protein n=1 Tax=Acinetobacter ursingii TaxID=108980 RepID=UPI00300A1488